MPAFSLFVPSLRVSPAECQGTAARIRQAAAGEGDPFGQGPSYIAKDQREAAGGCRAAAGQ